MNLLWHSPHSHVMYFELPLMDEKFFVIFPPQSGQALSVGSDILLTLLNCYLKASI